MYAWWSLPALGAVITGLGLLHILRWAAPAAAETGVKLAPADAPQLFKILDDIREALHAPVIHSVHLETDFNASIRQSRSSDGQWCNELFIGMPLLECLSPSACTIVLAHEYAHIANRHGQFATRIYFARRYWRHTLKQLDKKRSVLANLLRLFVNWYVPRLLAVSEPLSRKYEHQADREAAQLYGANATATTLASISLQSNEFEHSFWRQLIEQYTSSDQPIPAYTHLAKGDSFLQIFDEAEAWVTIHAELCLPTFAGDSHPSLAERVAALHVNLEPQSHPLEWQRITPSAASIWFGDHHIALAEAMDHKFKEDIRQKFEEATKKKAQSLDRYHALLAKRRIRQLLPEQVCELAMLTHQHTGNNETALEIIHMALDHDRDSTALLVCQADILFSMGRVKEAALAWQAVSLLSGEYQLHCLRQLTAHALRERHFISANAYREQADKLDAYRARESILTYENHNLSKKEYEALTAKLQPILAKTKGCWLLKNESPRSYLLVILPADTRIQVLMSHLFGEATPQRRDCEFLISRIVPTIRLDIQIMVVGPTHPIMKYCTPLCRIGD
ncbi:TPA: M48 family metalloprotease [Serratia liquefaciens]|nr:M48 family metalloprotease [Serratia liquefaciens]